MKNIRDMNKGQLRRHVQSLWREEDRLLRPYDCGQALAEEIGPPRIRAIRLELADIETECGRRNRTGTRGVTTMFERAIIALVAIAMGVTAWNLFDVLNRLSGELPLGF